MGYSRIYVLHVKQSDGQEIFRAYTNVSEMLRILSDKEKKEIFGITSYPAIAKRIRRRVPFKTGTFIHELRINAPGQRSVRLSP